jgi:hypothetical protein
VGASTSSSPHPRKANKQSPYGPADLISIPAKRTVSDQPQHINNPQKQVSRRSRMAEAGGSARSLSEPAFCPVKLKPVNCLDHWLCKGHLYLRPSGLGGLLTHWQWRVRRPFHDHVRPFKRWDRRCPRGRFRQKRVSEPKNCRVFDNARYFAAWMLRSFCKGPQPSYAACCTSFCLRTFSRENVARI